MQIQQCREVLAFLMSVPGNDGVQQVRGLFDLFDPDQQFALITQGSHRPFGIRCNLFGGRCRIGFGASDKCG